MFAMDHIRIKPKSKLPKRFVLVLAGASVLGVCGIGLATIDFSTQRIARDKVTISTVQRGLLEVKIHANGQLIPRNVEYLAAQVTGRVIKKNVRPGDAVKAGDVLAELSNPQLVVSAAEAKDAWEGAVNALNASKADSRAQLLNQQSTLMQAKFALQKAKSRLAAENALPPGIIPELEHEATKLNAAQASAQLALETNRTAAIQVNIREKLNADQSRADELKGAMERANDQVSNLRVVAGIDGIVQEMNVEAGQQLQPGAPIGRIAKPDDLYAELLVSAREANDVQLGQNVSVDTRNGTVDGKVSRIDPAVLNGTVAVDVALTGKIPASARPQLPVEGVIYVSRIPSTLYVGRPSFVKSDATVSVYKLDASGNYANRVTVRVGKVSLDYMQVLSGLSEGDRLITSETGEWQGQDRILLK